MALAAIALIMLMPVLSRSMPASGPMMGMAADCGMTMDHAGHAHPGMPSHPDDPTARCGYCVLLTHTPVVSIGVAVLIAPINLPAHSPQTTLPRETTAAPLLSARPRGPPLAIDA
jgi:hypothetical protein